MPIKVENNHINVAVRDLLSSPAKTFKTLSSFPLPQRGMLGKQAQIKSQQQKQKSFGLFHREYPVSGYFHIDDYSISVNGRIDGIYEVGERIGVIETLQDISEEKQLQENMRYYVQLITKAQDIIAELSGGT